jgi:Zn-dependent peptidase ImmA (M78 family)
MFLRDWAQKGLQRGDLNALLELKRGWNVPRQACLERLSDREFIEEDDHGTLRVTVKGRVALLLGRR